MHLFLRAGVCLAVFAGFLFPQNTALIVTQKLSGTVGFYDAAGNHLADAKAGQHPHEMALSLNGNTLYVSDNGMVWMTDNGDGENTISVIDGASRKRTATIHLGQILRAIDVKSLAPHMVMLGPGSEWAFTSDSNSGDLSAIRLATGEVRVIPACKRP